MLFRRGASQRLKPMGVVRRAHVARPLLHGFRHLVGKLLVERLSEVGDLL